MCYSLSVFCRKLTLLQDAIKCSVWNKSGKIISPVKWFVSLIIEICYKCWKSYHPRPFIIGLGPMVGQLFLTLIKCIYIPGYISPRLCHPSSSPPQHSDYWCRLWYTSTTWQLPNCVSGSQVINHPTDHFIKCLQAYNLNFVNFYVVFVSMIVPQIDHNFAHVMTA